MNDQVFCAHGIYHLIEGAGLGIWIIESGTEPRDTADFGIGSSGDTTRLIFERRSRIPGYILGDERE